MLDEGIQLLTTYKEFKSKHPNADFADFGLYLQRINTEEEASSSLEEMSEKMPFKFPAESTDEYIGWLWGRLLRYTHIWEKKALEAFPINSTSEFGILMYTMAFKSPTKSQIAKHSLMEKTTTFELIKRLISKDFLEEKEDATDKRAKRITLSKTGSALLFQVLNRIKEVSKHLTGDLTEKEKEVLFKLLSKLSDFHDKAFLEHSENTWESMME
jgi:DNA-binding MarR family transcriptional regulator